MDLDLQNIPRQTKDLDLPTTPQFSVCREVAAFIASCGILRKACEGITSRNDVDYFVHERNHEGVAYVCFPLFSTEYFVRGSICELPLFFYDCLKGDAQKPALVHEGALNRFRRILEGTDFQKDMKGLKAQTTIFVGHSMGGAVAALASLFYLQKRVRGKSYFCITFGSPLVGNAVLGEAIAGQGWVGNFCHVVSNFDIVPRMLLAPFDSIVDHLNEITSHWGNNGMSTHSVAVTSLVEKVLPYTSGMTSPYRPFGTYMFCSTKGAACIDDSEAVPKMLHFTMQGIPLDQYVDTFASNETGYYGKMLEAVTDALLNATPFANSATDPFQAGIALELEAMAVGAQNHDAASNALKKSGEKKHEKDTNADKLNEDLSKMQSNMAEVEWYKADCTRSSGYYDSFKQQKERRDMHVNIDREKLERFWKEEIVEKSEKHVLPSDLRSRNKWINAGTAYRRLVEPLDIAHHYRTRKDTSYLSHEVRPRHHEVLEKWLKEKEQTRGDRGKKDRTMFASLTSDSCFWARIEDSSLALANLLPQNDLQSMKALVQKQREFQNTIWNMIKDKSVSKEVFLEGSSFVSWWEHYKRFMTWWEQRNPSSCPLSSTHLYIFMQNEEYNS